MITAALATLPLLSQAGQSVANSVAQNLAGIFSPQSSGSAGQNVPASASSSGAGSATASLSSALTSTLLSLQSSAQQLGGAGGHHHHHGGGETSQTGATDQLFNAADATGAANPPQSSAVSSYTQASALSQLSNAALTAGTPIASA